MKNASLLKACGLSFTKDPSGSFKFITPQGTVMFYPSTSKFMHRGKVHRGDGRAVEKYVRSLL
ncbi:hypothetical protein [Pantoea sp. aB]|uniref:hypothetical protein n=1 Tax=Pantoea sp. aB TaxID=517433 RepID=UPI00117C06A1|nr:hypothetical protein [Pantoea sp. aB]